MVCGVMLNQLQQVFLVTSALLGTVSMSAMSAAWAETVSTDQRIEEQEPGSNARRSSLVTGHESLVTSHWSLVTSHEFLDDSEGRMTNDDGQMTHDQPATTVEEWLAQIEASLVQITGVRIETTESGLQVVLETVEGELTTPATQTIGNAVIADIPNAVLALPEGEEFQQANPIEGIALVSVTGLPNNRVRVAITGVDAPPTTNLSVEASGLVLAVTPGTGVTDPNEEAIQVVVTATRTEEDILDVPRSVTVITREEIEEQSQLTTNLQDILSQTVPGLAPPTFSTDFNASLRGRNPQILIDGVPISSNQDAGFSPLTSIAPSAIEQIEVVRGPSAVFGEGATGGVINIITRSPSEDELTTTVEARVNSRGDLAAGSFGTYLEYGFSGTSAPVDYVFNFAWESFGVTFDGAGDQIPRIGLFGNGDENGRSINVLGRLGVNIDENQRLQASVNHFDVSNEIEFINDPTADDDPDADKARVLERDIEFIDLPDGDTRRYTNVSLNYSHEDIFGSQLRLQGFYRNNFNYFGVPFQDTFSSGFSSGAFIVGGQQSERFGGRVEIETPFSETFNLLWGADYSQEEASFPRQLLDDEFLASGFRVARVAEEVDFVPPYTVENLGLFAQAQ